MRHPRRGPGGEPLGNRIVAIVFAIVVIAGCSGPALADDVDDADIAAAVRAMAYPPASPDRLTVLRDDVTCDGGRDAVVGYVAGDSRSTRRFVMVVVTREAGVVASDAVVPRLGGEDDQASLCAADGAPPPELSLERFAEADARTMTGLARVCPVAIKLDDGLCDAHRYFWLPGAASGSRLVLVRN